MVHAVPDRQREHHAHQHASRSMGGAGTGPCGKGTHGEDGGRSAEEGRPGRDHRGREAACHGADDADRAQGQSDREHGRERERQPPRWEVVGREATGGRRGGRSAGLSTVGHPRRPQPGRGGQRRGRRGRRLHPPAGSSGGGATKGPLPGVGDRWPVVARSHVGPPGPPQCVSQRPIGGEQLGCRPQLGSGVHEEATPTALDVASQHLVAAERDDRRAHRPRLGDHHAEALERRRVHERDRTGQRGVAGGVVRIGDDDHVGMRVGGHDRLAEEHEPQRRGPRRLQRRERVDQPAGALARVDPPDIHEVRVAIEPVRSGEGGPVAVAASAVGRQRGAQAHDVVRARAPEPVPHEGGFLRGEEHHGVGQLGGSVEGVQREGRLVVRARHERGRRVASGDGQAVGGGGVEVGEEDDDVEPLGLGVQPRPEAGHRWPLGGDPGPLEVDGRRGCSVLHPVVDAIEHCGVPLRVHGQAVDGHAADDLRAAGQVPRPVDVGAGRGGQHLDLVTPGGQPLRHLAGSLLRSAPDLGSVALHHEQQAEAVHDRPSSRQRSALVSSPAWADAGAGGRGRSSARARAVASSAAPGSGATGRTAPDSSPSCPDVAGATMASPWRAA